MTFQLSEGEINEKIVFCFVLFVCLFVLFFVLFFLCFCFCCCCFFVCLFCFGQTQGCSQEFLRSAGPLKHGLLEPHTKL